MKIILEERVVDDHGEVVIDTVFLEVVLERILEFRGELRVGEGVSTERTRGEGIARIMLVGDARLGDGDGVNLQNTLAALASEDHLLLLGGLGNDNVEKVLLTLEKITSSLFVVMVMVVMMIMVIVVVTMLCFLQLFTGGKIISSWCLSQDLNLNTVKRRRKNQENNKQERKQL